MPFGMVSVVGRVMGELDGGGYRRRRRSSFVVEFWASHYNAALPKLLYFCHFVL